ncbi:MAG: hypothetical protein K2H33_01195 [Muribaculaceae bacterium]|nr:hypothetical protein [Muribaculaceae bacterium]
MMNTSIDNDYAPGISETVAAAVVASEDARFRRLIAMALREAGMAVKEMRIFDTLALECGRCRLFVVDCDPLTADHAVEILRLLRRSEPGNDCAIVMLSHEESVAAYDAGVDMVLCKPVSVNMFMARVRSIMRRYQVII